MAPSTRQQPEQPAAAEPQLRRRHAQRPPSPPPPPSSSPSDEPAAGPRRLPWLIRATCRVLRAGPIPHHVAFIMDGNRRFAVSRSLSGPAGHQFGYEKLLSALEWCLELGVGVVSVYAFSIENFKRTPAEVETLMGLAEDRLAALLSHEALMRRHDIRLRVVGNLGLLPPAVQKAAARAMAATAAHSGPIVNICIAYTGREDILQAAASCRAACLSGLLKSTDVTLPLLHAALHTGDCPPVSLLVRTSGERRLSDFLMAQSAFAELCFSSALWPEFTFVDMAMALIQYQRAQWTKPTAALGPVSPYEEAAAAAAASAEMGAAAAAGLAGGPLGMGEGIGGWWQERCGEMVEDRGAGGPAGSGEGDCAAAVLLRRCGGRSPSDAGPGPSTSSLPTTHSCAAARGDGDGRQACRERLSTNGRDSPGYLAHPPLATAADMHCSQPPPRSAAAKKAAAMAAERVDRFLGLRDKAMAAWVQATAGAPEGVALPPWPPSLQLPHAATALS